MSPRPHSIFPHYKRANVSQSARLTPQLLGFPLAAIGVLSTQQEFKGCQQGNIPSDFIKQQPVHLEMKHIRKPSLKTPQNSTPITSHSRPIPLPCLLAVYLPGLWHCGLLFKSFTVLTHALTNTTMKIPEQATVVHLYWHDIIIFPNSLIIPTFLPFTVPCCDIGFVKSCRILQPCRLRAFIGRRR